MPNVELHRNPAAQCRARRWALVSGRAPLPGTLTTSILRFCSSRATRNPSRPRARPHRLSFITEARVPVPAVLQPGPDYHPCCGNILPLRPLERCLTSSEQCSGNSSCPAGESAWHPRTIPECRRSAGSPGLVSVCFSQLPYPNIYSSQNALRKAGDDKDSTHCVPISFSHFASRRV